MNEEAVNEEVAKSDVTGSVTEPTDSVSTGSGLSPLLLLALATVAVVAGLAIGRFILADEVEAMTGEVISDGSIIAVRDESHVAAIDLSESFASYGVDARIVGFDDDGSNGLVVGLSQSTGADLNRESVIVRVAAEGPDTPLVSPENGLLGVLGVVGSSVIYQELVPSAGSESNETRVMSVGLDGGEPQEIAVAPLGDASVGGDRLLYLENVPCVKLMVVDLVDNSTTTFDPYPDEPGICWDTGVVTSTYLADSGDRFVYLHLYNTVMQARIVDIDGSVPDVVTATPNIFSLSDVGDAAVQAVFVREPVVARVGADHLTNRQELE